jgi:glucose-6-phosphate 1-dehydrogenase
MSDDLHADCTLVILGASGDLTRRLLFPAVHRLMVLGRLSPGMRVVGYGVEAWTSEEFVTHLSDGVNQFGEGVDDGVWAEFSKNATYVSGDLTPEKLGALAAVVTGPTVFYLALPPTLFGPAATGLGSLGLSDEAHGFRRLVIEKPFGTSLATAQALQAELLKHWEERQLFRIDHFLGKDTVQNMVVFRFANRFIESIWNVHNITQVQITASETIGLEGRWRYYDGAGALRDMLQNHLMQLFALCAMEPPAIWDGEIVRQHRVEVLRSVHPKTAADVDNYTVRGQYGPGSIAGEAVVGYLQEENIPTTSTTETYAAVQLFIDNWRWQGVPFTLRSGKRLSGNLTEIALELRDPPTLLFASDGAAAPDSSWIVLRIRPDETIEIHAVAKTPGLGLTAEPVVLSATDAKANVGGYTAYEQLILDVLIGDSSLFIRGDEAEQAWKILQPVLDAWASGPLPLTYDAGSDGPAGPPSMIASGHTWRPLSGGAAPESIPG